MVKVQIVDNARLSTGGLSPRFTGVRRCLSVGAMSTFTEFLGYARGHVDHLADFDRQAALDAGLDSATVNSWALIHSTYFGPTKHTRMQRQGLELARAPHVSLPKLALIERLIRHIDNATERWRLRHQLLVIRGRVETLREKARDIIPPKEPAPPNPGVRVSRTSRGGYRRMLIDAPERFVSDTEHTLRENLDPDKPAQEQMLEKFMEIVRGDGAVPEGVYRPIVSVPVDDYLAVKRGENAGESLLTATDGTTVTLAELLQQNYGEPLEVAAFHPVEGALGLFRTSRHANDHQRDLLKMEQPECAWVGCHTPADLCQMHHADPWKTGGYTNIENLVPLCPYHNGVNDDDPLKPRHGRVVKERGQPVWISPRGFAVPKKTAHSAMRQLFGDPPG